MTWSREGKRTESSLRYDSDVEPTSVTRKVIDERHLAANEEATRRKASDDLLEALRDDTAGISDVDATDILFGDQK